MKIETFTRHVVTLLKEESDTIYKALILLGCIADDLAAQALSNTDLFRLANEAHLALLDFYEDSNVQFSELPTE